jgi:hypothetical protein
MGILAAGASARAADGFLAWAFLVGVAYVILSFFFRRIGGKGGGSDRDSVGAWWPLAAIVVGLMVATR